MPKDIPFVCISKVATPMINKFRRPNINNYTFYNFHKLKKCKKQNTEYSKDEIKTETHNSTEIFSKNKIKELESKINKLQAKLLKEQTLNQVLLVNKVNRLNLSLDYDNDLNSTAKNSNNSKSDDIFEGYELSFVHRFKQKINTLFKIIRQKDNEIDKLKTELNNLKEENAKLKENVSFINKSISSHIEKANSSSLVLQGIDYINENEDKVLHTLNNKNSFKLNREGNIEFLPNSRFNQFRITGFESEFERPLLTFLTKISKVKDLKELMIEFLS